MQVVGQKVAVSPDVDWDVIADATDGFSGADLQAVVYNAHLDLITSSAEEEKQSRTDRKGKGKAKEGSEAEEVPEVQDEPIEYYSVGGPDPEKPRSRAEEKGLQRSVRSFDPRESIYLADVGSLTAQEHS